MQLPSGRYLLLKLLRVQFLLAVVACISFSDINAQNQPPVVNDGLFRVARNSTVDDVIARVDARDPNIGDRLTYSITGGNDSGGFTIDNDGIIRLTSNEFLYRSAVKTVELTVRVTDNGGLSDDGTITIKITEQQDNFLADLLLTNTVDDNTKDQEGDIVTFTIRVQNLGPNNTGGAIEVLNDLGDGYDVISSETSNGNNWNRATKIWEIDSLNFEQIATLTIVARLNSLGEDRWGRDETRNYAIINEVMQTQDSNDNNDEAISGVGFGPKQADLQITKTIDNQNANIGEFVTFTIVAENLGPERANRVRVFDQLPNGYLYISDSRTSGTYNPLTGEWSIGNMEDEDEETLTIEAIVLEGTEYLNTAIITHNNSTVDPNPDNNESSDGIVGIQEADMAITKSVDNTDPSIGDQISFTITARNNGPSNATNIDVVERLRSGYTYLSHTTTSGTYNNVTGIWTIDAVNNGTEASMTLNVSVNEDGEYYNSAQLFDLDQVDPNDANDFAEIILNPPKADLAIRKSFTPQYPNIGDTISFTLNLSNLGPSDDKGIIVEDILNPLFTYIENTASQGTYNNITGEWTVGDLANTVTAELVIKVIMLPLPLPADSNTLNNIASIKSSNAFDPNTENNRAEIFIDLPTSDIAMSKTVSESFPNVGEEIIFTVTALNNGPSTATGLLIEDKIPSRFNYVRHEATLGSYDNTTGIWNIGQLNRNGQAEIDFFVTVNAQGDSVNRARVTGLDQFDPIAENDTARERVETKVVDLSISKSISNSTPNLGEEVIFTVRLSLDSVANTQTANNITVLDLLPSGYEYVNHTTSIGDYEPSNGEWTITSLPQNVVGVLDIAAKVLPPNNSDYVNTAKITSADEYDIDISNDEASATIDLPTLDIEVIKTVDETIPNIGETVIFTISVRNIGPSNATGLTILDEINNGFIFYSALPSIGSYDETSGIWTIGNLPKDQVATLDIAVQLAPFGNYSNTAKLNSVDQFDNNTNNDQSSILVTPQFSDLALQKTVSNSNPRVNDNIEFTITLSNLGPASFTNENIIVSDQLPSGFSFVSYTTSDGSAYDPVSGLWLVNQLAKDASKVLSINVRVNASGDFTNIAQIIGSDIFDPNQGNNTASASTVAQSADLSVTKTVDDLQPNVGDTITFSITVDNNGPNLASAVTVTDQLPSGYTYYSHSTNSGTYDPSNGAWSLGSIAPNSFAGKLSSVVLNIEALVLESGIYSNTATITASDQSDPDTSNNSSTITPNVLFSDLSVSLISDKTDLNPENEVIIINTLANNGPDAATNITTNFTLPDGLEFIEAFVSVGAYNSTNGQWTVPSLGSSSSAVLSVKAKMKEAGALTIQSTISRADQFDPDTSNNTTQLVINRNTADINISKVVDNPGANVGQTVVFTITADNIAGPNNATGLSVLDKLPDGLLYIEHSTSNGSFDNVTDIWTIGNLNVGETAQLTITAQIQALAALADPNSTLYTNRASVNSQDQADPNSANNSATVSVDPAYADLSLSMDVDIQNPNVGDEIDFTIRLLNNGPDTSKGIQVTDQLPSGYTYVSHSLSAGTYNPANGIWDVGDLAFSAEQLLTLTAIVNEGGNFTNIAEITETITYDPNSGDNIAVISIVAQTADLALGLTVDNERPNIGGEAVFTLTVTNLGPDPATSIEVKDSLNLNGFVLTRSSTDFGSYIEETGTWELGGLNVGQVATLTLTTEVLEGGPYDNKADIIRSDQFDPVIENNSKTIFVTPLEADLSIGMAFSKSLVVPGEEILIILNLRNLGPDATSGVQVTDRLPLGMSYVSHNATLGAFDPNTGVWQVDSMATNEAGVLIIRAEILANATYENTATITASDVYDRFLDNNSITKSVTVQEADVQVEKSADKVSANVNENVEFTIVVTNNGPETTSNLTILDLLEDGFEFIGANPSKGTYSAGTGLWTINDLVSGAQATITINAKVLPGGNHGNTASVNSLDQYDPDPTNDESSVNIEVPYVDLEIEKDIDNPTPNVGEQITFTVTLTHLNSDERSTPATNILVTDQLPDGFTFISHSTSKGNYDPVTGLWTVSELVKDEFTTLNISATVKPSGDFTNIASITSADQYDPQLGNNTASISLVAQNADLSISKTISDAFPDFRDTVNFTVNLTNLGPDLVTNVTVKDQLPSGYIFINSSSDFGNYDPLTGIWQIGSVNDEQTATLSINASVTSNGEFNNIAKVDNSSQFDPNESNNADTVVVTLKTADLKVSQIVSNANPNLNEDVIFVVTLENLGPFTAETILVNDLLPSGLTYQNHSASRGSYNKTTGIWDVGDLASGSSVTLSLVGRVQPSGTYTNVATITSSKQLDPDLTNNTTALTIAVNTADLAISKTVDRPTAYVGEDVTFTITLDNTIGPNSASEILVQDLLPSAYTYKSHTAQTGTYNPETGEWSIPDLAFGSTSTLTITAQVKENGDYQNVASIISSKQIDPVLDNNSGDASISIFISDVALSSSISNRRPLVDENITLTLTATNNGPNDATEIEVTYTIPDGLEFVSVLSSQGTINSDTRVWQVGNLTNGSSANIVVEMKVNRSGSYIFNAEITNVKEFDNNSDNDQIIEAILPKTSELEIAKQVDNALPNVNDTIQFTLTLTNNGFDKATNVAVSDTLNSGFEYISSEPVNVYDVNTGKWAIDSLISAATTQLIIKAKVLSTGSYLNKATITQSDQFDPNSSNNSSEVTVNPRFADLAVSQRVSDSNPLPGQQIDFVITAQNLGPNESVDVNVFDDIPNGFVFISSSASDGSYDPTTHLWSGGNLASGGSATLTLTVEVQNGGNFENVATMYSTETFDQDQSNNTATQAISLQTSDIGVTKSVDISEPLPSENFTYTIIAKNNGPANATGLEIEDQLPDGLELVTSSASKGIYNSTTGIWNVGSLANADADTLSITVKRIDGLGYVNRAELYNLDQYDDNIFNDIGVARVNIQTSDIAVSKTVDNPQANVGETVIFSVTALNNGLKDATGLVLKDILPNGYTYIQSNVGNNYNPVSGEWTIGPLSVAQDTTMTLEAVVLASGEKVNTASLLSLNQIDPEPSNNSASAEVISPFVDLAITKSVDQQNVAPETIVNFTVTLTNGEENSQSATNVEVTEVLPAGYELQGSYTPSLGSFANGIWSIGELPVNTTATLIFAAKVLSTGDKTTTSEITKATEYDPDQSNNFASASVEVARSNVNISLQTNDIRPNIADTVSITVSVGNIGPDPATNLLVRGILPSGLQLNSVETEDGVYDPTTDDWDIASLKVGDTAVLNLTTIVLFDTDYSFTSSIISLDQEDDDPTNNTATLVFDPLVADLEVGISTSVTEALIGEIVSFNITLSNQTGPDAATDVIIDADLPLGYTYQGHDAPFGTYDPDNGKWSIPNINFGSSVVLSVDGRVLTNEQLNYAVRIDTARQFDPNKTNNTAELSVLVRTADLQMNKSISNFRPNIGDQVDFVLRVSNAGPDAATGIQVLDEIPSGYQLVDESGELSDGIWLIDRIEPNGEAILTVPVIVLEQGARNNEARITQLNEYDPDRANNVSDANTFPRFSDLKIEASARDLTPNVGDTVKFSYTLSNFGLDNAHNVHVTNLFGTGFRLDSVAVSTGSYDESTGIWEVPFIEHTSIEIIDFWIIVGPSGIYDATTTITSADEYDPRQSNNSDQLYFNVQQANLSIEISVDNPDPHLQEEVNSFFTIENLGPNIATEISVLIDIPEGLRLDSYKAPVGTLFDETTGNWTIPAAINGQSIALEASFTVIDGSEYLLASTILSARQQDPDLNNNSDEIDLSPQTTDVGLQLTVDDTNPEISQDVIFSLLISNENGPWHATGVTIDVTIPSGYNFVSASTQPGDNFDPATGLLTVRELIPGANSLFNLRLKTLVSGVYEVKTELIDLNEIDIDETNDIATQSVTIQSADLSIVKSIDDNTPDIGQQVQFTTEITNNGIDAATNVQVLDWLESGYELLSFNASDGIYDQNSGFWNLENLTVGATETLIINATVKPIGSYNELAVISSPSQIDPNPDNNSSEVLVTPVFADLAIDKRASTSTPNVGETITFTLNISNVDAEGSNATGIQVEDILKAGYTYQSDDSGGDYDPNTGIWNVGDLNVGATKSLNIQALVLENGPYRNLAKIVASDQYDPDPTNNLSLIFIDAQQADLAVNKTVNNSTPAVGETIIFEITLDNLGLDLATDVVVSDRLPSGYQLRSHSVDNGIYDTLSGDWTLQIIDQNTIATLLLAAEVLPTGDYDNTAQITASDQDDPDPSNNQSTVIVTPQKADIAVDLLVNNVTPVINETVVFTLNVKNNGGSDANNVSISQVVPDGLELTQAFASTGDYSDGIWTIGDMANGAQQVLTLVTTVKARGNHTMVAEVASSDQHDPDDTNNIDIINLTLQSADLSVSKKVESEKVEVGATAVFSMVIENKGPYTATNVVARDKLPPGYTYVSHTVDNGIYFDGSGLWIMPSIAVGGKAVLIINALVTEVRDYENKISVISIDQIDTDLSNNSSSAGVSPQFIDIALYKRVNRANPNVGDTVTFEVLATNHNKDLSQGSGIRIFDQLPPGFEYLSYQATKGSYDPNTNVWNLGSLFSGEEQNLFLSGIVKSEGPYLNVAFISAQDQFDPNLDNNLATATIEAQSADLSINKVALTDSVGINELATFEIQLTNNGPDAGTNIKVQDQLPNGYNYVSSTSDYGSYNEETGIWSLGNLDTAQTATLNITATVIHNGLYNNTASIIDADQADPVADNNISSAAVVPVLADLSLSMTASNTKPKIGEAVGFTVGLNNLGPINASNIQVTDIIPNGFVFQSFTATSGNYDPNTGLWTVDQVPTNGSETLTLILISQASGNHTNQASITDSDQWDPVLGNNSASISVFMQVADIAVTKTVNNSLANVGENVTFTITASNGGPQDASSLSILDQLPNGYTFVSASDTNYDQNTGIWSIGDLAINSSSTLNIVATVLATGNYENTASVNSSDQVDNNTGNNRASATVTPPIADLAMTKTVSNSAPNVGENVIFTLTVDNSLAGNNNASGVQVTDVLPTGYTYVSDNGAGAYVPSTGIWTIGNINSGVSASLQITATVNASGNPTNIALITAADQYDPVVGNNIDFATTATLSADLSMNKTVNNPTPNLNENVIFTISLSNNGPDIASGVQVTDQLPTGYTYVSDDANGKYNSTTGIWDVGTINDGSSYDLNITATVSNINGQFINTAAVTAADQNDPDSSNNSSSASVTVQQADLVVSKTVNNNSPIINEDVIFTITMSNNGPANATGVQLSDVLPSGYVYRSSSTTSGTYDVSTGLWDIGNINNGGNQVLTLICGVLTSGNYENTAAIINSDQYDPDRTNNSATASTTLQIADVALEKTVDNSSANIGEEVIFTITATNNGPQNASNLSIKDQLPNGFAFVSASESSYDANTGIWNIGNLANAATSTLNITATVLGNGSYTNTASINSSDQIDNNGSNDSASATVNPPLIDLSLTKTIDSESPNVGEGATFKIILTHNGPSESDATNINVLDRLPEGLGLATFTPSQGQFDRNTGIWTVGDLAFGASATLELLVTVDEAGPKTNVALITQVDQFDPNKGNNIAVQSLITQSADLALTKTVDNELPQVEESVIFTITVKNNGPDAATSVEVSDLLPSGFSYVGSSSQFGSYDPVLGKWTDIQILPDSTATLFIQAEVLASGDHTNRAAIVNADQVDPNVANNADSVTAAPQIADLSIVKTVDTQTPNPNTNVIFEVRLTNTGPSKATNIIVDDLLPSGFTFVSGNASSGNYDQTTGLWEIGEIANNGSELLVITAQILAEGDFTNIATILTADQFDPDLDNNESRVTMDPARADLSLSKTVDNPLANVGDLVTFTVELTNQGPDIATNVITSDVIPNGYTLESSNTTTGNYNEQTGIWVLESLGLNSSENLSLQARVNAEENYVNQASILQLDQIDYNLNNNIDGAAVTPPIVDLSISKSVNEFGPIVGDTITFKVLISHNGPDPVAATNVKVTDPLPSGYTFITSRSSSGTYDNTTGLWDIGTLGTYESASLEIDASVLGSGRFTNIAVISGADQYDPNIGDNIAFASIIPLATDVSITKTVNEEKVVVGDTSIFNLSVKNIGPDPASNIRVQDLLPIELGFIDFTANHGYVDSNYIWNIGNLGIDSTATLSFRAEVLQTNQDSIRNIAQILGLDQTDNNTNNNVDTAIVVIQRADLAITKGVDDPNPVIGQSVVFNIGLTNNGPANATNIIVKDQLPSGYKLKSFSTNNGIYDSINGTWTIDKLTASSTINLTMVAEVNASGDFLNTAEITKTDQPDPDTSNNSASAKVTLQIADLAITKEVNKKEAVVGENIAFIIKLTNNGPSDASNILVQDVLPNAYAYVSSSTTIGTYSPESGIWQLDNLANGASTELILNSILLPEADTINTTSIIKSDQLDNNLENNSAKASVTYKTADLEVIKTADRASVSTQDTVTFEIRIKNFGPNTSDSVIIKDLLPQGLELIQKEISRGSYIPSTGLWTLLNFKSNEEAKLNLTTIVQESGDISNTANIQFSSIYDSNDLNNSSTVDLQRITTDLAVIKTASNLKPSIGDTIQFEVTVTNEGQFEATNIVVRDIIQSGFEFIKVEFQTGSLIVGESSWFIENLSAGARTKAIVDVKVLPIGNHSNTAEIIYLDQVDDDPNNNSSTIQLNPELIDLKIEKTASDSIGIVGQEVTFTSIVTNLGPSDGTNIKVFESVPEGYEYVSHTLSEGTYDIENDQWSLDSLIDQAQARLDVVVKLNPEGNNIKISIIREQDQFDTDLTNNISGARVLLESTDIGITKTLDNNRPLIGDTVLFTVEAENLGGMRATNIEVIDKLPTGFELVGASGDGSFYVEEGLWKIDTIDVNTKATLFLRVKVLPQRGFLNLAYLNKLDQQDPNDSNNVAFAGLLPQISDLAISKRVSNERPRIGDEIDFTISLTNNGIDLATNIEVLDTLAPGFRYISSEVSKGSFDSDAGTWSISSLGVTEVVTLTIKTEVINAAVNIDTDYINYTSIQKADQYDPNEKNNEASSFVVLERSDLSITKSIDNDSPVSGGQVNFTVNITNNGPYTARDVFVLDRLPSGYEYVSSSSTIGTYDEPAGAWAIGSLVTNETHSLTIVANVNDQGEYTNIAEAFTSSLDPDLSNNIDSVKLKPNNPPIANDNNFTMLQNSSLTGSVAINDSGEDGNLLTYSILSEGSAGENGTIELESDGIFRYTPDPTFNGDVSFRYQVCDNGIPIQCAEANVFITVTENLDVTVPNGFSPNNDGTGDTWMIEGIEVYPNNTVKIFNRWGNIVWEANGYNNQDVAWNGDATSGIFISSNGEPLPDATYFYTIDLKNGAKPLSGFVVLKRTNR